MRKPLAIIPAALLLASCGANAEEPPPANPSPTAVVDTFSPPPPLTSTPSASIPSPVTSPPPTDAPKLLDTSAQVLSLAEIDPAIAEAHGFLPTEYYPLTFDPDTYCSVEDTSVCGTPDELWAAFEEDFDKWAEEGGMPPVEDVPLEDQQAQWDSLQ